MIASFYRVEEGCKEPFEMSSTSNERSMQFSMFGGKESGMIQFRGLKSSELISLAPPIGVPSILPFEERSFTDPSLGVKD